MDKLKSRGEIGIFALGGLGEVGKNMYCIDYLERLYIIDAGVLFPDEHLLGVDYVIPGNDDAIRAIELYLNAASDAIKVAKSVQAEKQQAEEKDVQEAPAEA